MKTLKFDTKSWHWYLAHEVGNYVPSRHGENLCAYTRRVLLGAIKVAGAAAVVGVIVAGIGYLFWNLVFGIIFSILMHTWFFTDEGMAVVVLSGVATGLALLYGLFRLVMRGLSNAAEAMKEATIEKKDSFAANAYDSWHNKFCARLEFDFGDEDK